MDIHNLWTSTYEWAVSFIIECFYRCAVLLEAVNFKVKTSFIQKRARSIDETS